jgi:hypothetical protein
VVGYCVCLRGCEVYVFKSLLAVLGAVAGGVKKPPKGVLDWVAQPKPGQDPERAEVCICLSLQFACV